MFIDHFDIGHFGDHSDIDFLSNIDFLFNIDWFSYMCDFYDSFWNDLLMWNYVCFMMLSVCKLLYVCHREMNGSLNLYCLFRLECHRPLTLDAVIIIMPIFGFVRSRWSRSDLLFMLGWAMCWFSSWKIRVAFKKVLKKHQ